MAYGDEVLDDWSCPWCDADNTGPLAICIDDIDEKKIDCCECGQASIVRGDYVQESGYVYWFDKYEGP